MVTVEVEIDVGLTAIPEMISRTITMIRRPSSQLVQPSKPAKPQLPPNGMARENDQLLERVGNCSSVPLSPHLTWYATSHPQPQRRQLRTDCLLAWA